MKKLILILSILVLGCETTTSTNNQWTFDQRIFAEVV